MRMSVSHFRALLLTAGLVFSGCINPEENTYKEEFVFTVCNVGQGLSQIGIAGDTAVVWDIGSSRNFQGWHADYEALGGPYIKALIISHTHEDHFGGVSGLSEEIPFSGRVITTGYEDTTLIRRRAGPDIREDIVFSDIMQGQSLDLLRGVEIECIWPPQGCCTQSLLQDSSELKNRYSLCFRVDYGETDLLITSDIDTSAAEELSDAYGFGLNSDVFIVPHHGSRISYDVNFFTYAVSEYCVVSCGSDNDHGHPHSSILDMLFMLKPDVKFSYNGMVRFTSNREYWSCIQ